MFATEVRLTTVCEYFGFCAGVQFVSSVVVGSPIRLFKFMNDARGGELLPPGLGERAERVTNAVLAALLAELTTLNKDRVTHTAAAHLAPPPAVRRHAGLSQTAAAHAAPPPAAAMRAAPGAPPAPHELLAALEERDGRSDNRGVVVREKVARVEAAGLGHATRDELLQHQIPELLADLDERGSRVTASTEQCRASTGAMRAEMATFAAAMQITPVNTPPRREDSPSSGGARVVIRARGHGAIGFVRLPLAAEATGVLAEDWRGRLACHYRRGELAGDCSPGGKPAGATFAAVRAAISAQLGEDLSTVAHALPAGASCSMVNGGSPTMLCSHPRLLRPAGLLGAALRVGFGCSASCGVSTSPALPASRCATWPSTGPTSSLSVRTHPGRAACPSPPLRRVNSNPNPNPNLNPNPNPNNPNPNPDPDSN